MEKTLFTIFGLILLIVWIGLLVPQYNALKNKHYRSVAIFMIVFALSAGSLITIPLCAANEFICCILGLITVPGHFFCLWFTYFRKTWDYLRINGYSDKQIRSMLDPEAKRLLGLPQ